MLELLPEGDLFEQVVRFGGGSPSVAEDAYTEGEVRELLRTALRGLAALHEMSIVHRDIKPENLVLSEAGGVVTTWAREALATGELCSDVVGTAGYMSPEGCGAGLLYAADVWSLGVVLDILSGSRRFRLTTRRSRPSSSWAAGVRRPNWGDVSDDAKRASGS